MISDMTNAHLISIYYIVDVDECVLCAARVGCWHLIRTINVFVSPLRFISFYPFSAMLM